MRTENLDIKIEQNTNERAASRFVSYKKKFDSITEGAKNEKNNRVSDENH